MISNFNRYRVLQPRRIMQYTGVFSTCSPEQMRELIHRSYWTFFLDAEGGPLGPKKPSRYAVLVKNRKTCDIVSWKQTVQVSSPEASLP
jgi:hypothetical protein